MRIKYNHVYENALWAVWLYVIIILIFLPGQYFIKERSGPEELERGMTLFADGDERKSEILCPGGAPLQGPMMSVGKPFDLRHRLRGLGQVISKDQCSS